MCLARKMQRIVALSVTEAELIQCVECAQDMLYVMHVLEDMGLKVNKPMILECDNQGAVNIANNWSSMGRTRHMDVRYKFKFNSKISSLFNYCQLAFNPLGILGR